VGTYAVEMDAIVSVTAYPYSGYEFDHWEIWETDIGKRRADYPLPTYQFAMPGPFSLTAHFRLAGTRPSLGIRAGAERTATAVMTNPTSKPYDYEASLFLGLTAVARSNKSFHLNASESKNISFPITMPADLGLYPVYLSIMSGGESILLYRGEVNVVIIGPSSLLYSYYNALVEAYTLVEAGYPNEWVMIPGYGLQYAQSAIPQLEDLMRAEAIGLGLIASSTEAYFVRAVMYFSDGETIVPYWWSCSYCSERFRSPELLEAHFQEAHYEIINTKASITGLVLRVAVGYPSGYYDGLVVTWRNDSPFSIRVHVSLQVGVWSPTNDLTATENQDALVTRGGSVAVFFPYFMDEEELWLVGATCVTLTLVGGALPGMVLDIDLSE